MTLSACASSDSTPTGADQIRVMVVDDSVVIRGLISRWLEEMPEITVVASHRNGRLAADDILRSRPDVVVLDIEMPEMDGLTALPLILDRKPGTVVLVASTLTQRGAEMSLKALTLGAADYLPKPASSGRISTSSDFRRELIEKVRHLGRRGRAAPPEAPPAARAPAAAPMPKPAKAPAPAPKLRPYSTAPARILAIGSSTGGPQALMRLFREFGAAMDRVPVLVTQHMPPTFTTILAAHLGKVAGRPAMEGRDGEPLAPGHIYVAPGGKHMLIAKTAGGAAIHLSDGPPVNFCRPAVDPLFRSVAEVFRETALAIVLTGMGSDGAAGASAIANAGGSVIAQDAATSVVWGMPGAAAAAGACSDILPIDELGRKISRILLGARA